MNDLVEIVVEPDGEITVPGPTADPWDLGLASYLATLRGHTLKAYRTDLLQWSQWCDDQGGHPLEAEAEAVEAFTRHVQTTGGRGGKPAAAKTVSRKLAAMASCYRYLVRRQYLPSSPLEYVDRPSSEDKHVPTPALDPTEAAAVLQAAVNAGPVAHVALRVLFGTGIRSEELLNLDVTDVVQRHGFTQLQLRRKGSRQQMIPVPASAADLLWQFIGERTEGPLLQWKAVDARMTYRQLYDLLGQLGRKAGVPFRLHPHVTRATFATTNFDAEDGRADWLSDTMGHKSRDTTGLYDRGKGKAHRLAHAGQIMDRTVLSRVPVDAPSETDTNDDQRS